MTEIYQRSDPPLHHGVSMPEPVTTYALAGHLVEVEVRGLGGRGRGCLGLGVGHFSCYIR